MLLALRRSNKKLFFSLWFEPTGTRTQYRTRGEHTNYYTTDVVRGLWIIWNEITVACWVMLYSCLFPVYYYSFGASCMNFILNFEYHIEKKGVGILT